MQAQSRPVVSVDLAYARYSSMGVAVLHEDDRGIVARGVTVPLADPPVVESFADWLEALCEAERAVTLCIDGPSAWQGASTAAVHGVLHSRVSERATRAPGKTGLPPDGVKPRGYLGFTRFSIALFQRLTDRGWRLAGDPRGAGELTVLETFPTAAWRALGMPSLPGKARSRAEALAAARDRLAGIGVRTVGITTHDEWQAVVGGIAGVRWAQRGTAGVRLCGIAPFRDGGCWREGYIVLPSMEAHAGAD